MPFCGGGLLAFRPTVPLVRAHARSHRPRLSIWKQGAPRDMTSTRRCFLTPFPLSSRPPRTAVLLPLLHGWSGAVLPGGHRVWRRVFPRATSIRTHPRGPIPARVRAQPRSAGTHPATPHPAWHIGSPPGQRLGASRLEGPRDLLAVGRRHVADLLRHPGAALAGQRDGGIAHRGETGAGMGSTHREGVSRQCTYEERRGL